MPSALAALCHRTAGVATSEVFPPQNASALPVTVDLSLLDRVDSYLVRNASSSAPTQPDLDDSVHGVNLSSVNLDAIGRLLEQKCPLGRLGATLRSGGDYHRDRKHQHDWPKAHQVLLARGDTRSLLSGLLTRRS
jgi:hypothetical protein